MEAGSTGKHLTQLEEAVNKAKLGRMTVSWCVSGRRHVASTLSEVSCRGARSPGAWEVPRKPSCGWITTGRRYGFSSKQQIQLEKKKEVLKKRGLSSPDCGDMVAMTFAQKITTPSEPEEPYYRLDESPKDSLKVKLFVCATVGRTVRNNKMKANKTGRTERAPIAFLLHKRASVSVMIRQSFELPTPSL